MLRAPAARGLRHGRAQPPGHLELAAMGHDVQPANTAIARGGFGGGQVIATDLATGELWAAADRRKDGLAAWY